MPLTEASILSNFLLPPAPLPAAISLRKFTELFPHAQQSSPQIPALYRELQHQRAIDTDDVKRNIAAETKRGEQQKREVIKARKRADKEELEGLDGRDIQMEIDLFGPSANTRTSKPHTLQSVQPAMAQACSDLEAEIADLEAEADAVLADMKTTVGDLSDLRYGRFARAPGAKEDLGQEVIAGLERLTAICEEAVQECGV